MSKKDRHTINLTKVLPYKSKQPPLIVKVQRPIRTNESVPMYLIYNADRSIFEQLPETLNLKLMFPQGVYKVYRNILFNEKGQVMIGDAAPEQEW